MTMEFIARGPQAPPPGVHCTAFDQCSWSLFVRRKLAVEAEEVVGRRPSPVP
jgi:hypothetical protein